MRGFTMDRKTKNRILGAFVLVGMIVIMLPFFQSSEEVPSPTALVTAPSFPDQAIQVPAPQPEVAPPAAEEAKQVASTENAASTPVTTPTETTVPTNAAPVTAATETAPKTTPTDTVQALPVPKTLPAAAESAPASVKKPQPLTLKTSTHKKAVQLAKNTKPKLKAKPHNYMLEPLRDDGLFALKNPAWVVQLGSFRDKANALRLVNELRASGYRAFIQQFSSTFGDNTRVFVGPENRHADARNLANELEEQLHLHGIVISYKPLTL